MEVLLLPIDDFERKWRALACTAHTNNQRQKKKNFTKIEMNSFSVRCVMPPLPLLHPYQIVSTAARRCVGIHIIRHGLMSASVRKVTAMWINRRSTANRVGGSFSSFSCEYLFTAFNSHVFCCVCVAFFRSIPLYISCIVAWKILKIVKKWTNTQCIHICSLLVGVGNFNANNEMVNGELFGLLTFVV